jgi:F420H(2)-dependent quinone reductase
MMAVVQRVHKLTGNKMSGQPLLYLHTVGAKSGQPRTAAVMAFAEGDDTWLVVASRAVPPATRIPVRFRLVA